MKFSQSYSMIIINSYLVFQNRSYFKDTIVVCKNYFDLWISLQLIKNQLRWICGFTLLKDCTETIEFEVLLFWRIALWQSNLWFYSFEGLHWGNRICDFTLLKNYTETIEFVVLLFWRIALRQLNLWFYSSEGLHWDNRICDFTLLKDYTETIQKE